MTEEYIKAVFTYYKKLERENKLNANLSNPTPANLRDESFKLYLEQGNGKEIIRPFLKDLRFPQGDVTINHLDIDKFKAVQNFLSSKTTAPSSRVINLVSWLINFDSMGITAPIATYKRYNYLVIFSFIFGAFLMFLFIVWQLKQSQCMYWTGDHYEKASCTIEMGDTAIIALNVDRLENMKRIVTPDTINYKHIGKIWYAKPTVDSIDFYTDSGGNPVNKDQLLKPLTKYMIDKYIRKLAVDSASKR